MVTAIRAEAGWALRDRLQTRVRKLELTVADRNLAKATDPTDSPDRVSR